MSDFNNDYCAYCKKELPPVFPAFTKASGVRVCDETCETGLFNKLKDILTKTSSN